MSTYEKFVRTYLHNERLSDLYKPNMTINEAERAVRSDPRYVENCVRTFLHNEKLSHLYNPNMTMHEAECVAQSHRIYRA